MRPQPSLANKVGMIILNTEVVNPNRLNGDVMANLPQRHRRASAGEDAGADAKLPGIDPALVLHEEGMLGSGFDALTTRQMQAQRGISLIDKGLEHPLSSGVAALVVTRKNEIANLDLLNQ